MILAPNGEKLSKRHASVSALDYRDKGFLPDAVLNYLARLGWSHGDQEIFSRDELIALFDWEHVGSGGAKYDAKKFDYVQASHLRMLSNEVLAQMALPFFEASKIHIDPSKKATLAAIDTVKTRAVTLMDVVTLSAFYFEENFPIDDKARNKFLTLESSEKLGALREELRHFPSFDKSVLEEHVHQWLSSKGWALKDVAQPARVALTGQTQSPGLFEMMEVLGKDRTLARFERALDLARKT
jgi:glutamyl-tRNA synthetase